MTSCSNSTGAATATGGNSRSTIKPPVDLVPIYFGTSNIDRADGPIKAGQIGYAKGIKSSSPPFLFDGPANADLGYRCGSTSARISIAAYADGTITREIAQDYDQRMSVDFPPDTPPGDRPQVVVFSWPDLWGGPNYNGWEFELTNTCDHDLIFVPEITTNVASCPPPDRFGRNRITQGQAPRQGWPGELQLRVSAPRPPVERGRNCHRRERRCHQSRMTGSASGTTDILYTANPAANAVQTVTYLQR